MELVKRILLQILQESAGKGIPIGKTHLVKLLYLTEVEVFRETRQRLTQLNWVFYLYGPYAYELENILKEPEFQKESVKTSSEKDFVRFTIAEPSTVYGSFVDAKTSLLIKKIVGQWASKPLSELLDYVYFQTEPMQHVKHRGEKLDFNTIQATSDERVVIPMTASSSANERIKALRSRLQSFFETMGQTSTPQESINPDYNNALTEWEEENHTATLPSNLTITITNSSDSSDKKGN